MKKIFILCVLNAIFWGNLFSKDIMVDEIVISATRTEENKEDVAVSIEVINNDGVVKKPAQSVLEVLRDIPGITISGGASNGLKYVSIRGESTRRTLILVDGQPLTQQKSMEGGMPFIGKNEIEKIEVVKGPSSVLYGSEAIGGVINIITKKGVNQDYQVELSSSYNTANKQIDASTSIRGNYNNIDYAFNYGKLKAENLQTPNGELGTGGKDAKDPTKDRLSGTGSENDTFSAFIGYKTKKIESGIKFDLTKMNYEVYTDPKMFYDPSGQSPMQDMTMNIPDVDRNKISAFFKLNDINNYLKNLDFNFFRQETKRDFDIFTDLYKKVQMGPQEMVIMDYRSKTRTHNEQISLGGNLQAEWNIKENNIITGVNFTNDNIDGTYKEKTITGEVIPENINTHSKFTYDSQMTTYAIYLQDQYKFHNIRLIGGLRYTFVNSKLDKTNDPSINNQEADSDDSNLAFSLGTVYNPLEKLFIRANFSQGYRHPNLVELYTGAPAHGGNNAIQGNTELKPETSNSFELGGRYNNFNFNADVALFYTDAKDYIGVNQIEYINIGSAKTIGTELSLSYNMENIGISPYTQITFMNREYDYGNFKTDKSGTTPFNGRFGVKYFKDIFENDFIETDLFMRYNAETEREFSNNRIEKGDSWNTFNLELSYTFLFENNPLNLEIFAGIYNITDEDYKPYNELAGSERSFVFGINSKF